MHTKLICTEIFDAYPEASRFSDRHNAQGYMCLITNCNDGFIVDVYEKRFIQ